MNASFQLRLVAIFYLLAVAAVGVGQEQIYEHTTGIRGTRMWIPPDVEAVKGIFIYGNGAGGDTRNEIFTPWNQAFAYLHDFALVGTSQWTNLSGNEIDTWDDHLSALATASGHPELVHAPWAPIGFSNGGQMSYGFNALRPEKTFAFITQKGCCYNIRLPSEAALKTPGILIAGELDTDVRNDSIQRLFNDNRPRGALWSWVEQQGEAHSGRADALVLPFMAEAIRLRYPAGESPTASRGVTLRDIDESEGWLADQSTWKSGLTQIASYDDYPGGVRGKQRAGWLLNENVAFLYRAFSTYDRQASLAFDLDLPFLPPDFRLEAWIGVTQEPLLLELDLSAIPDWTKVELFNYAESILTLAPSDAAEDMLKLQLPIPNAGIYGLSALVTHGDGTISTTNPLVYNAIARIPEPSAMCLLVVGIGALTLVLSCGRRL
jgi:predicted esterase